MSATILAFARPASGSVVVERGVRSPERSDAHESFWLIGVRDRDGAWNRKHGTRCALSEPDAWAYAGILGRQLDLPVRGVSARTLDRLGRQSAVTGPPPIGVYPRDLGKRGPADDGPTAA